MNWQFTKQLFTDSPNLGNGNMIAILQNCSHLVFTDLALLMLLEFRIFTWTDSLD